MIQTPHKDIFSYLNLLLQKGFRGFSLFFLAGFVYLLYLGTWQIQRLEEKVTFIQSIEDKRAKPPRPFEDLLQIHLQKNKDIEFLKTTVVGTFDPTFFLKWMARVHEGTMGYHYLGLFNLETGGVVLVDLGWMPASQDPTTLVLPTLKMQIQGTVRYATHINSFTPDNHYDRKEVFSINPTDIQTHMNISDLYPVYIANVIQGPTIEEGPLQKPFHLSIRNQHLNYALTWYALAIVWLLCFIFFMRYRLRTSHSNQS